MTETFCPSLSCWVHVSGVLIVSYLIAEILQRLDFAVLWVSVILAFSLSREYYERKLQELRESLLEDMKAAIVHEDQEQNKAKGCEECEKKDELKKQESSKEEEKQEILQGIKDESDSMEEIESEDESESKEDTDMKQGADPEEESDTDENDDFVIVSSMEWTQDVGNHVYPGTISLLPPQRLGERQILEHQLGIESAPDFVPSQHCTITSTNFFGDWRRQFRRCNPNPRFDCEFPEAIQVRIVSGYLRDQ